MASARHVADRHRGTVVGMNPDPRQRGRAMTWNDLRKGRASLPGNAYHITTVTRNRAPYFAALDNGRRLVRELMALQAEGRCETLCYVAMPDHLHWLMALRAGTLADAVRLLKGRSVRAIGRAIWQPNYFDHAARSEEDLRTMARYIVANPLRTGLVERIGDYPLWDAIWLDETLSLQVGLQPDIRRHEQSRRG